VHPKLVDTMLALARDENALALQVASEEPAAEGGNGAAAPDEQRGPRRGRRPAEEGEKE
jgi:hypothetical protein